MTPGERSALVSPANCANVSGSTWPRDGPLPFNVRLLGKANVRDPPETAIDDITHEEHENGGRG